MLLPLILLVIAEVTLKGLLAPWAVDGVCDRRKGRDGLVFARVAKELGGVRKCTVIGRTEIEVQVHGWKSENARFDIPG